MVYIMMIRRLDQSTIDKIKVGESIEGPFNVIKEVIENSLDSGSSKIQIKILRGGMEVIEVQDNGIGIDKQDLPLLCKRHCTSKIQNLEDLKDNKWMGFRGEALASISIVSELEVITKTEDSVLGVKAVFKGDQILEQKDVVYQQRGTTVSIQKLFFNYQQRMKSIDQRESSSQILKYIQALSLQFGDLKFSLEIDNK